MHKIEDIPIPEIGFRVGVSIPASDLIFEISNDTF